MPSISDPGLTAHDKGPKSPENPPTLPRRIYIGPTSDNWVAIVQSQGVDPSKGEVANEAGGYYWELRPEEITDLKERAQAERERSAWSG
ncbi:MAG: hypothetical protein WC497_05790 [Patescibacteria group bacterium]